MRNPIVTISLAAALATAQISFAQQSPDPRARTPAAEAATVSDAEIETFAAIYVDLLDIAAKLQAEVDAAQTEQQALEITDRAQAESIAKVTQHGWTPERFNRVGEVINSDPALTDKAVKLIAEK